MAVPLWGAWSYSVTGSKGGHRHPPPADGGRSTRGPPSGRTGTGPLWGSRTAAIWSSRHRFRDRSCCWTRGPPCWPPPCAAAGLPAAGPASHPPAAEKGSVRRSPAGRISPSPWADLHTAPNRNRRTAATAVLLFHSSTISSNWETSFRGGAFLSPPADSPARSGW